VDESLPLLEHFAELRKRLIYALLAIILCSIAVYPYLTQALNHLIKPVGKLVFISPVEAFWGRIKFAFFLGLFVSTPFVFWQIWKFISRGLLRREKKYVLLLTFISLFLFSIGAALGYFFVLPVGMKFLLAYGTDNIIPMISFSRYLSFVFTLVFSFGIIFELPLAIGFLTKTGILESKTLKKQRRLAIVGIFILAAALTPGPDIFSQVLMAGPLLILYEAGIIVAGIMERRR
jgi:sec-independent protein translocase protein TatC